MSLRAERRILSVLFADIVGFTSLSERLDAEDVAIVQERYFQSVRSTVERYGGRIEKFIGDAVLASFGIPRAREDDAERAVRAGLALANAAERVGAEIGLDPPLRVRVGVNTGEVVRTEGAQEPLTGDAVNVANRLQTSAAPGEVVIGEATALAVEPVIEIERMGPLALKGRTAAAHAWRAVTPRAEPSRDHAVGRLRADTIGRDAELGRLLDLVRDARGGATLGVLVVAPPGVGKSRLLGDLARWCAGTMSVLRGRLRADRSGPYDEIVQIALAALALAGVAPEADAVRRAIDERGTAAGWSPGRAAAVADLIVATLWPAATSPLTGDREQLFDAVVDGVDALTAPRPALWLIEDVHWANADVLAFLRRAATRPSATGRLVVLSARPAIQEEVAAGDGAWTVILLPPLAAGATAELVRAMVADALPSDLVAAICERADGNPLFIEELLRSWVNVGRLAESDGGWRLTTDAREVAVPPTVQAIYAAQLDDLPPPARTVAQHGSVAGRRFPRLALPALDAPADDEAVGALLRRSLVSGPEERPIHGPLFTFRHALLRDTGYGSLGRAERARLHVRYARWLEGSAKDAAHAVAEEIAEHYASAHRVAPTLSTDIADGLDRAAVAQLAAAWWERAGDACVELAANVTAMRRFTDAASLGGAAADRARRTLKLGAASLAAGRLDDANAAYRQAMAAYRALLAGDETSRVEARAGLSAAARGLGDVMNQQLAFADAERLASDAIAEVGDAEDVPTARLLLLRAHARINLGVAALDEPDTERALRVARATRDRELELEALATRAAVRGDRGVLTREEAVEVEGLARQLGRWDMAARWLSARARLLLADDPRAAQAAFREVDALAEARGLALQLGWSGHDRTEIALLLGEWDEVLDIGMRTIERAERDAQHRVVVRTWFPVTAVAVERRDVGLLRRAYEWHEAHRSIVPDSAYARVMHGALALRFARAGLTAPPLPEAEPLREGFEHAYDEPEFVVAVHDLVSALIAAGRTTDAGDALGWLSWRRAQPPAAGVALATETLLRGELAAALGDPGVAEAHARDALATFRSVPAPWWTVLALRLLRRVAAATPDETRELRGLEASLLRS